MKRTVLIGLDGATFHVLDRLMEAGEMPFLQALIAEGVRAPLRSTIPALTPPAWTTLMTGRNPGAHGIFDFFRRERAGSPHIRFLTSRDVGTEMIWSLANHEGCRATVLNFPLTFPAPAIDGYVVPGGFMPWKQLRLGCRPRELYDQLKGLPGFNPRELAMDMSHEEKALEGCAQDEYEEWIALHIRREQQWFNVLRHLMETDPTELTAVLFDGVDKLQHLCWRFIDPELEATLTEPWEWRVREQCLAYFRTVDRLMAEIGALAGPDATIVIASDHGFGPQVRTFFVNAWLAEQGVLRWRDGEGQLPSEDATLGVGQIARHVYQMDWDHTVAYAPMPSGNGIHIVRQSEETPHGVPDAAYEPLRERLIQGLLTLRDPHDGQPVVAAVWRREEVFEGPYLALAPDLTLELQDGGLISILASAEAVTPRPQPTGTHAALGVFAARGPLLAQGAALEELSIVDVPSLLLYTLDVTVPAELEGTVPQAALLPEALHSQPIRVGQGGRAGGPDSGTEDDDPIYNAAEEEEMMMRLRALGYVE